MAEGATTQGCPDVRVRGMPLPIAIHARFHWQFLAVVHLDFYTRLLCESAVQQRENSQACSFLPLLGKEKVTKRTWEEHRDKCSSENEWFLETLPKSEVSLLLLVRNE